MRVLVVEATAKLAQRLARGLSEEGCEVDIAAGGEEALRMGWAAAYDVIILDAVLPDLDGLALCGRLRERGVRTRLLMLSVRDAVGDRVAALGAGANDYLLTPFAFDELLARLRALARRAAQQQRGGS